MGRLVLFALLVSLCSALSGKFLQLTDIHLDLHYKVNSSVKDTHCNAGSGDAHPLGERFYCDSPSLLMQKSLQYVAGAIQPDFILLTGDFARHDDYAPIPRTFEEIMTENSKVAADVASLFPDVPVIPSIGNNDVYPHDVMYPPGKNNTVLPALAKAWAPLLNGRMHQMLLEGGWMVRDLPGGNQVVSLNTIYFAFKSTDCDVGGSTGLVQMEWLAALLDNALTTGKSVILSGHVPTHMWLPGCRKTYAFLSVKYSDIVKGQIFGHLHSDQFHFVDTNGNVDTGNYTSNSTMAVMCSPSIVPSFNPSYRVYDYDPTSLNITDYTQYYADIEKLYTEAFTFEKEYSLKEAYKLQVSSTSLSDIDFWIQLNSKIKKDVLLGIQYELYKYVSVIKPPQPDEPICQKRPYNC